MRRKSLRIAPLLCLLLATPVNAQDWRQGKGRIEGSVTDPQGNPIAGASVALRHEEGGGPDLKTDKKGRWKFLGMRGGNWSVEASAPGYRSSKYPVTVSEAGRGQSVAIQLEPEPEAKPEEPPGVSLGGQKISQEAAEAIEKGNAALAEKNYGAAAESYRKALAEVPNSVSLLTNIAMAYYFDNKPEEALSYARQTVAKAPDNASAWLMISELELQKGNLEAGKEALAKVPAERIVSPQPYLNIGILYYNAKKPAEAEDYFSRAIAMKGDLAAAYYYRGLTRYQVKRTADAKADLQKSIELAPTGADADTAREILKTMK